MESKKTRDRLDYYKDEIKNLNDVERLDKSDIKKLNDDIKKLNGLRNNITDEYARGTINKEQYENLSNDILNSHREIFTKNIRVLYNFYEKHKEKILSEINSKIEDTMLVKG
jgi:hypothetical protein